MEKSWVKWLRWIGEGALLLALTAYVVVNLTMPRRWLRQGDAALAAGDYEGAIAAYERTAGYWMGEEGRERVAAAHSAWGAALLAEGDETGALDHYALAKDEAGERAVSAHRGDRLMAEGKLEDAERAYLQADDAQRLAACRSAMAKAALDAGDYETAADYYKQAGDEAGQRAVWSAWGEAMALAGDLESAQALFYQAQDDRRAGEIVALRDEIDAALAEANAAIEAAGDGDDLTELYHRRGERALEAARDHDFDPVYARQVGVTLTDMEGQLTYCTGLRRAGCDLTEVYPEGVRVSAAETLSLRAETLERSAPLAPGRTVILERREVSYLNENAARVEVANVKPHDPADPDNYEVRLRTDLMAQLPEANLAESWAQADTALLVDVVYPSLGEFSLTMNPEEVARGKSALKMTYEDFAANESVVLYDLRHSGEARVFANGQVLPNSRSLLEGNEARRFMAAMLSNRLPVVNETWLNTAVETAMATLLEELAGD